MAGGGVLVARSDRARLPQGGGGTVAGARLPGPHRRDVAPGAALRLTRDRRDQRSGVPWVRVTTNMIRNIPITRIRTPISRGCADCMCASPTAARDRVS